MTDRPQRVLYLEDVASIAEMAIMALEDIAGYEVVHADNGPDAIEAWKSFKPDLCLFDVMLPGMDGPETLARIRGLAAPVDVPAIFLTAKAQLHEQDAYLELGVLGVIIKPFNPITLGDEIDALWAKRAAAS